MVDYFIISISNISIISIQPPQTDTPAAAAMTKTEDDVDEGPPPSKQSDKGTEELFRQKEQLEHERVCTSLK